MAIILKTRKPKELKNILQKKIETGFINDWSCDKDGDFTYNLEPLNSLAWFRPYIQDNKSLTFGIIRRNGYNLTIGEYSMYHSLFTDMLIRNFIGDISHIEITMPLTCHYDSFDVEI